MIFTLICIGTSFFYPCNPYFNTTEYVLKSRDEQCFEQINKYAERSVSAITGGGSLILDIITWIYLIMVNKKLKQHSTTNSVSEKRFFIQVRL